MNTKDRTVTIALVAALLALIGSMTAITLGYTANDARISDIQESRRENLRQTCLLANRQNRAIVLFVIRYNPRALPVVSAAFPYKADCEEFARRRLKLK